MNEMKKQLNKYCNAIARLHDSGAQISNSGIAKAQVDEQESYNWIVTEFEKVTDLHKFVVKWMVENEISCTDSIHQSDGVQEQLTAFACHCFKLVESELPKDYD